MSGLKGWKSFIPGVKNTVLLLLLYQKIATSKRFTKLFICFK